MALPAEQIPGFDYTGFQPAFVKASQARAAQIHELETATTRNVIEIGKTLKEQRDAFGSHVEKSQMRGGDTWSAWVQAELGWRSGRDHANRFIQIYERFGVGESSTPPLGYEIMKMLATRSTPQELVDQVVDLARNGNLPTIKQVRNMKKEAANVEKPTPTEAKERAQATGEVVEASDGKYYTPLTDDEREKLTGATNETYDVIDAVHELSTLSTPPADWLGNAAEHQLIDLDLGSIEAAIEWLKGLSAAYRKKGKVIDAN